MQRWYSDKNFRDISDLNWYNCTVESSHATASKVGIITSPGYPGGTSFLLLGALPDSGVQACRYSGAPEPE
jgi:hypothetical protein